MDVQSQFQIRTDALRGVQNYIKELQKLNINDVEEVNKFIEAQISNYKELVKELNSQIVK
jgi:hypothetical protein